MSPSSFLAGLLSGILIGALAVWLGRRYVPTLVTPLQGTAPSVRRTSLLVAAGIALFAIAATIVYLTIAHRTAAVAQASPTVAHPGVGTPGEQAQSMEAATAGLAARLARSGGTDQEWDLLAQSYEFLGRPEDAKAAREHRVLPSALSAPVPSMSAALQAAADASGSSGSSTGDTDDAALRAQVEQRLKSHPQDVEALIALATLDARQQQYASARDTFAKVIALKGMTADSWADYADVLAALSGGALTGEAGLAIERSLALDPKNEKGLWLKASRAIQEHRYADALALWKTLRATLPAGSQDAQAVDANIAEATQLVAGGPGQSPPAGDTSAQGVAVSGTVSIAGPLAKRVDPQATLFIYATAVNSPGPPLAVLRTTAGAWPVRFRLDDSMAMLPSRRLSQFDQVVIEARVSRSGQATPAPGDLYVTSPVIKPRDGKPVALVISHQIS